MTLDETSSEACMCPQSPPGADPMEDQGLDVPQDTRPLTGQEAPQ